MDTKSNPISGLDIRISKEILDQVFEQINVALIIPHGRSGSMLMQSLFDNHPEVVTFPYWFKSYGWEESTTLKIVERFASQKSLFGGSYLNMGTNKDNNPSINEEKFKQTFSEILDLRSSVQTAKEIFICAHIALAIIQKKDLAQISYIILHLHSYGDDRIINKVVSDFPQLKLIAMWRDPRDEWVSYQKAYSEYGRNFSLDNKLFEFVQFRSKEWYQGFLRLQNKIGPSQIKVIDLNFLHREGPEIMTDLSKWMSIHYRTTLTQSTFLGHVWGGNSFLGDRLVGFNPEKGRSKWKQHLSIFEKKFIEFFLQDMMLSMNYTERKTPVIFGYLISVIRIPSLFYPKVGSPQFEKMKKTHPNLSSVNLIKTAIKETIARYNLRKLMEIRKLNQEFTKRGIKLSSLSPQARN